MKPAFRINLINDTSDNNKTKYISHFTGKDCGRKDTLQKYDEECAIMCYNFLNRLQNGLIDVDCFSRYDTHFKHQSNLDKLNIKVSDIKYINPYEMLDNITNTTNDVIENITVVTDDEYVNNDEEHQLNICNINKFVNTTYNIVNINKYKKSLNNFRNNMARDYINNQPLDENTFLNAIFDDVVFDNEPIIEEKKKKVKYPLDIEDSIKQYVNKDIRKQIHNLITSNLNNEGYVDTYIKLKDACKSDIGWNADIILHIEDIGDKIYGVSDVDYNNPCYTQWLHNNNFILTI